MNTSSALVSYAIYGSQRNEDELSTPFIEWLSNKRNILWEGRGQSHATCKLVITWKLLPSLLTEFYSLHYVQVDAIRVK